MRVVGVNEGAENVQKTRDFVAQMLMDVLKLDERPVINRTHRALCRRPGDSEPPRHLVVRIHHCYAYQNMMQKVM